MDDQFLYLLREKPDPKFVKTIKDKLDSRPSKDRSWWKRLVSVQPFHPASGKRAALTLTLILFIALITMLASPTVRAQVEEIITKIAGITFIATDQYPAETPFWGGIDLGYESGETPAVVSHQSMPLKQAQSVVPFKFIPTWVPADMEFKNVIVDQLEFSDETPGWKVTVFWERDICRGCDRSYVYLFARSPLGSKEGPDDISLRMIIGQEAVKAIKINGQKAALVRGYWFKDGSGYPLSPWYEAPIVTLTPKWAHEGSALGIRLLWIKDGVLYTLQADEDYVSIDELLQIAESIP